eukprot:571639-Prymnesium_polylepis.1
MVFIVGSSIRTAVEGRLRPQREDFILGGLPLALLTVYIFAPTVSHKLFSAFNCVPYEFDGTTGSRHWFLRDDASVTCWETDEHSDIRRTAVVMLILWPVGATVGFGALFAACGSAIKQNMTTSLVYASSFMHREYKRGYHYVRVQHLSNTSSTQPYLLCACVLSQPILLPSVAVAVGARGSDGALSSLGDPTQFATRKTASADRPRDADCHHGRRRYPDCAAVQTP